MLASPLPPSILDPYSLSMSSLGCSALCMVISFLVLWSICLSSSLVHFRKGPEYLTSDTAQVFIPLITFLLESFVSSSFLVLLRYSLWIFFFISICLMVSASKMLKYLWVSLSLSIIIMLFDESFSHPCYLTVFHWSLSDSKSSQDSRTLLSILADHNKAVVPRHPVSLPVLWWLYQEHQIQ